MIYPKPYSIYLRGTIGFAKDTCKHSIRTPGWGLDFGFRIKFWADYILFDRPALVAGH